VALTGATTYCLVLSTPLNAVQKSVGAKDKMAVCGQMHGKWPPYLCFLILDMPDNKRLVPTCIIIILSQSCIAENIDPEKIIGKTTNNVIYGDDGIYDDLYDNNSNRFTILGVKLCCNNKI
jgi:hypothetical protein